MATTTQIKFYKSSYTQVDGVSGAKSLSQSNPGGIYFDQTLGEIWVGGFAYGGGAVRDVNFAGGVLTITKSDGTSQTLDFNDVASAQATLAVFEHMNNLIGTATTNENLTAEYAGTHYLTSAANLIGADKALDTAIYNLGTRIDNLNGSATIATVNDNVVTLKVGVTETGGIISNTTGTDITLAEVAVTGAAEDVSVTTISSGSTATNVQEALVELAGQITAGNVSIDGQKGAFTTDATMITVDADHKVLGVNTTGYIGTTENGINLVADKVDTAGTSTDDADLATVLTVKTYIGTEIAALYVDPLVLATIATDQITIANVEEVNGKIGVNGTTAIPVDGTVSSNNKLVTESSIGSAIEDLDVTGYAQASVSNDEIKIYGIKEDDGKIDHNAGTDVTIKLGSNYNASSNKVALESNITDAINNLDVDTVQAVTYTEADTTTGAKLTFTGIQEENGEIKLGAGAAELQFAKVATSGTAADVAIADSNNKYAATDVEGALYEVKQEIAALAGGMRYNGDISSSTATLNTATNDIRPGDIYLASGAFAIGGTNVEAGDMIVYKGNNKSTSPVTLDASNCSIIERETDTMVTSGATLTTGQLVIGSGSKEVNISTITEANLLTAMANANSALQSIGHGTDGQYVKTTVSAKENNNQNVSVALTQSTVTYSEGNLTATDGVLTNSAVTPIKNYVDGKINALEVPTQTIGNNVEIKYSETDGVVAITSTEKYATIGTDLSVTNPNQLVRGFDIGTVKDYIDSKVGGGIGDLDTVGTVTGLNVTVKYEETNGIITIGTIDENYATVAYESNGDNGPELNVDNGTGLVVGNDLTEVGNYVDGKIGYEINKLDAIGTSAATGAVAQVVVEEADGKIGTVTVTNISAGVTVSTQNMTLTASNDTGAVTGADIDDIKTYIDAKATQSAAVVDTLSTVAVNSGSQTQIATVGGQAINTAVSFTWEEYE